LDEREVEDLTALLPPLLGALEALGFVARHLHPPDLEALMAALGEPEVPLRAARKGLGDWPAGLADVRAALETACDHVLSAFEALRQAQALGGEMGAIFRGLRGLPRAQEALYPLAAGLGPLNRFFLEAVARDDRDLQARLAAGADRDEVGVHHLGEPGARGGVSL
jgi:phospholipase/carboxylesterase